MDGTTPAAISLASTTDNGATYTIDATLTAGKTFTVTVTKSGYDFGTEQSVVVTHWDDTGNPDGEQYDDQRIYLGVGSSTKWLDSKRLYAHGMAVYRDDD